MFWGSRGRGLDIKLKAMVLAAGLGTRLGSLTREIPKPMLRIGEHPMLALILAQLKRHGFDEVMINLHFRPELIRDYFQDGKHLGIRLAYSDEPQLLGTAGAIKKVAGWFGGVEPFLIQYGDVVTDQDLTLLLERHRSRNALCTLLVHRRNRSNSILCLDGEDRILRFLERPTEAQRVGVDSEYVNSGLCMASPELL